MEKKSLRLQNVPNKLYMKIKRLFYMTQKKANKFKYVFKMKIIDSKLAQIFLLFFGTFYNIIQKNLRIRTSIY